MKKMKNTLLGVLLFALVIVVIGGFLAGFENSEPTPTSTTHAAPVAVAAPVEKPVAIAHPAEGELNKLGLTLEGGVGIRAGLAKTSTEGGTK